MLSKIVLSSLLSSLLSKTLAETDVTVEGNVYKYFGLTGYGSIPSDAVDKYDDTISIGSSVAFQKNSLQVTDGVYAFTSYALPDRGMNIYGTVNTIPRIHRYHINYTPMNSSSTQNIIWDYDDTLLLKDFNGNYMSGLDCNTTVEWNGQIVPAVSYHGDGWGNMLNSTSTTTALCLDAEALTLIDGDINNGFWISDEYGPGVYKFDNTGTLIEYIQAPNAILPYTDNDVNFSSDSPPSWDSSIVEVDNTSGRTANKGYEGMDISPDGSKLYVLLQAATVQDGGNKGKTRFNTRLVTYDISISPAQQIGEYVLVLPTYTEADGSLSTAAQSEMRIITDDLIMVLPRDSDLGHGGADGTESIYRHIDLYSLTGATNIMGEYDDINAQISTSKGKLNSAITPLTYHSFIDINDATELTKFGLHNGGAVDNSLLNEKWEGITLIPVDCTTDEYFLLAVNDNDYQTTNGLMDFGQISYDTGIDLDSQSLMFHIKLPTLQHQDSLPASCLASSSTTQTSTSSPSSVASSSSVAPSSFVASSSSVASSSAAPSSSVASSSSVAPSPSSSSVASSPSSSFVASSSSSSSVASSSSFNPSSSASSTNSSSSVAPSSSASSIIPTSSSASSIIPTSSVISESSLDYTTQSSTTFSNTTYTTVIDGETVTVTEPCTAESAAPTSYTTYTTVVAGETVTVTEPCTTEPAAPNSYTTYTTVTAGETVTVTEPCNTESAAPTSYTTYTTVVEGETVTVTEPCTTESSTFETSSEQTAASVTETSSEQTAASITETSSEQTAVSITETSSEQTAASITETNTTLPIITKSSTQASEVTSGTSSESGEISNYVNGGANLIASNFMLPVAIALAALV